MMSRLESITQIDGPPNIEIAPGVSVHVLAADSTGAVGVSTFLASILPGGCLPYHRHPFSEVITLVSGKASVDVEGRRYCLQQFDAIHVPAFTPHAVHNLATDCKAVLHTSFASATPVREAVLDAFTVEKYDETAPSFPEQLVRFVTAPVYELAHGAYFRDLFGEKFGARGVCGGYGVFEPGASLPCHYHDYDESITIVTGRAVCMVAGREYSLTDCGTACIPRGRTHRFVNRSDQPMAMIWTYAGDTPHRTVVESGYCDGALDFTKLGGKLVEIH